MGILTDTELRQLTEELQILHRKDYRREITPKEYEQQRQILEDKIREKRITLSEEQQKKDTEERNQQQEKMLLERQRAEEARKKLLQYTSIQNNTKVARVETMPEQTSEKSRGRPKKDAPAKVPKEKKPTRVGVILEVLKMKSIKNMEQAADKVIERMPGSDRKKVCSQISLTIGKVKKGAGKWAKYSWDAESYTLTEKA